MNACMKLALLVCIAVGFAFCEPPDEPDVVPDSVIAHVRDIEQHLDVRRNPATGVVTYRHTNVDLLPDTAPRLHLSILEADEYDVMLFASPIHTGRNLLMMHSVSVTVGAKSFAREWQESETRRDTLANGFVHEAYSFEPELNLLKAISGAPADTVIKVRLTGSKGNRSFTLTTLERQIWRDMVYYRTHFELRNRKLGL